MSINFNLKVDALSIPNQAIIGIALIGVSTSNSPNILIKAKLGSLEVPNQAIIGIALIGVSTPVPYVTLPNPQQGMGIFSLDVDEQRNIPESPNVWSAFSSLHG